MKKSLTLLLEQNIRQIDLQLGDQQQVASSSNARVTEQPMSEKRREENPAPIAGAAPSGRSTIDEVKGRIQQTCSVYEEQQHCVPPVLFTAAAQVNAAAGNSILAADANAWCAPKRAREEERGAEEEEKREKKQKLYHS